MRKLPLSPLARAFSTASHKLRLSHVYGIKDGKTIHKTVGQVFLETTEKYPDRPALFSYDQNKQFTYAQLYDKAHELASGFIARGLKSQDRIAIYSYNNAEWYLVQLAAAMADLILVNVNPAYQKEELAYTLNKVGCKAIITSSKFKYSDYLGMLNELIPELATHHAGKELHSTKFPTLKRVIKIDDTKTPGMENLSDYFHGHKYPLPVSRPNDAVNIQFTSGTTGLPKACTLSHLNIVNNGYIIGENTRYTHLDNICVPVPLYHCFGMIMGNMAALTRGAAITLVTEGFDPKKSLEAVSKYKCTSLYGVPTMFLEYLRVFEKNRDLYDVSKLRTGVMAGALCPEVLMRRVNKQFNMKEFTICYGMTETSPISFQTHPDDPIDKQTQTVGRIIPRIQARIVNENLETVPIGTPGEIVVKGEVVMLGYWGDEAATKKSIVDGWMRTGDLGVIDEEGYCTIVGRAKDMIIRGGENVYPKQVEDYIRLLKGVHDVQVVGVPDERFGEEICALIKTDEGVKLTNADIFQHCHKKIAHYKIPRYVKFVQSFPITVTGKQQKYKMREELVDEMKNKPELFKSYLVPHHH